MVLVEPLASLEDEYLSLRSRQQSRIASTDSMPGPVLLLVSPEADSLCSARMICNLLRSDHIPYTIKPVATQEGLVQHVQDTLKDENVISIFLINCGGTFRLVEELGLESRVVVYLLDSHRPYDLSNVHSAQVRILHDSLDKGIITYPEAEPEDEDEEDDDEEIEEIRRRDAAEDEDDEADEAEEDFGDEGEFFTRREDGSEGADGEGEPSPKRRKRDEKMRARKARDAQRAEEKRRRQEGTLAQRRARENQRMAAVRKYYDGTSFGCATSVLMYEMCNQLRKAGNNELWMSILGLTDQFLHERVARGTYATLQSMISAEAMRLGNETTAQVAEAQALRAQQTGQKAVDAVVTKVGHIGDLTEYRFPLLRHWSLYESLVHSPYVSARLETWTEAGKERVRTLLTEMGISLACAQQDFKVMGWDRKAKLDELIDAKGMDARYNIPDVRFRSFIRQHSPTLTLTACDQVQALNALLELPHHSSKEKLSEWSWQDGFWRAWGALGSDANATDMLLRGVDQARHLSEALLRQAELVMSSHTVKPGGNFRYVVLPESGDSALMSRPQSLRRMAHFLSECVQKRKGSFQPLIVASPIPDKGAHLVIAAMGTTVTPEILPKNEFGERFHVSADPPLPEREEGEDDVNEDEEDRRARLVETVFPELARLRVKQEAFDAAVCEVQTEDLDVFLTRLTEQE